jgi:hypothetical protein
VAEDWRVTITLDGEDSAKRVLADLHEREVRDELRDELGGRVAVSSDGPRIFLYADTRRAAEAGEQALREALTEERLQGEPQLDRWHPAAEEWLDASVPLPTTAEEREREGDLLEEQDEADSVATGIAQWEVRIELDSPALAEALADTLESEGYSVVRRSTYVLVGANDTEDAEELAGRLKDRGRVHIEPSSGVAWQLMPRNPFAVFGGLGG